MRKRTESLEINAADEVTQKDMEMAILRRLASMNIGQRPLVFGRIDEQAGERWYVGRRHVEDDNADPVVVEWRAPVALPYYRASIAEPMDLVRRRQFVADANRLLSMADDVFDGSSDGDDRRIRGLDALLIELERSRTGEMLDIVSTIQVEQDEVIRSAAAGVMAVQGGPGTGKTAVGLHRAAFLLYGNDALAARRRARCRAEPHVPPLRRARAPVPRGGGGAAGHAGRSGAGGEGHRGRSARRAAQQGRRAHGPSAGRRAGGAAPARRGHDRGPRRDPHRTARRRGRQRAGRPGGVAADALRERSVHAARAADQDHVRALDRRRSASVRLRACGATAAFTAALDRLWPSVTPMALVRDVLRDGGRRSTKWTDSDLPLIDEANDLIHGQSRTYGHVVVDEAQDLSPMQLRMLGRRCPSGSMTILGDVAQGIGVWAIDHWEDAFAHLPTPNGTRLEELHLGYRSPAQVLDLAARLLPEAAPHVRPTESVRRGRTEPTIDRSRRSGRHRGRRSASAQRRRPRHGRRHRAGATRGTS